ncbi:hypothetical protein MVEN_00846400 [Mycena venus]|uniref:Uncharacterized protein n=1 Tax=Mycena venus TaxID=2733690 RepID=A0A8H6YGT5_9AGAR|nr:hypothetical protein MVEN_00846400 [Mycena venus]
MEQTNNITKSPPKSSKEYRFVPQGHAAIEPIKPEEGKPVAIGTEGLTPCVGVYFKLGDKCFVAHFDANGAKNDAEARTLAQNVCKDLKARIEANLANADDLKLTVNDGERTSFALAWAVQQNFDTRFSPAKELAAPATLAEMKAALNSKYCGKGGVFYVENDQVKRFGLFDKSLPVPVGKYGESGFTF